MSGTAKRAQLGYAPVAGKTGTNANYRDAWFIGFTAHNVTGVWVGNDDNTPMAGSRGNAVTGGRVPAPAWKLIMDVAEEGLQPEGFPGVPMDGKFIAAPATTPAILDTNVDEISADVALTENYEDDSKDVLNGMFDLFNTTPTSTKAPKVKTAEKGKIETLVLPKANTSAVDKVKFLDRLFGRKPTNKKDKRKISVEN